MRDYEMTKALLRGIACGFRAKGNTHAAKTCDDAADAIEELLAVCKQQEIDLVNLTGQLAEVAADRDHLREAAKMMPKWISVEDELPEENKQIISYLAYKGMAVLQYENKHFYMQGAFQPLPKEAVTHWMPLPEPPKGVE